MSKTAWIASNFPFRSLRTGTSIVFSSTSRPLKRSERRWRGIDTRLGAMSRDRAAATFWNVDWSKTSGTRIWLLFR